MEFEVYVVMFSLRTALYIDMSPYVSYVIWNRITTYGQYHTLCGLNGCITWHIVQKRWLMPGSLYCKLYTCLLQQGAFKLHSRRHFALSVLSWMSRTQSSPVETLFFLMLHHSCLWIYISKFFAVVSLWAPSRRSIGQVVKIQRGPTQSIFTYTTIIAYLYVWLI